MRAARLQTVRLAFANLPGKSCSAGTPKIAW